MRPRSLSHAHTHTNACVCEAAWMKMPMQAFASLLFVFSASLTHTHTHTLLSPARAIMRRVCSCVRCCACAIIAFLHICLLSVSVFFLFSLIFSSVCVRRELSRRRCLRRVHKCKFTRTFEMCSHSGTKTFISHCQTATRANRKEVGRKLRWEMGWWNILVQ